MHMLLPAETLARMGDHVHGSEVERGGLLEPRGGILEMTRRVQAGTFDSVSLEGGRFLWHTHPARCRPDRSGSFRCTYSVPSAQDVLTMREMAARAGLWAHVVCTRAGWFLCEPDPGVSVSAEEVAESYADLYRRFPDERSGLVQAWLSMVRGWGLGVRHLVAPADVQLGPAKP